MPIPCHLSPIVAASSTVPGASVRHFWESPAPNRGFFYQTPHCLHVSFIRLSADTFNQQIVIHRRTCRMLSSDLFIDLLKSSMVVAWYSGSTRSVCNHAAHSKGPRRVRSTLGLKDTRSWSYCFGMPHKMPKRWRTFALTIYFRTHRDTVWRF